jgi:hypothetical protein
MNSLLVLVALWLLAVSAFQLVFSRRVLHGYRGRYQAHMRAHYIGNAVVTLAATLALLSSSHRLGLVLASGIGYVALVSDAKWLARRDDEPAPPLTQAQADEIGARIAKIRRYKALSLGGLIVTIPAVWIELGWRFSVFLAFATAAAAYGAFVEVPRILRRAVSRRGIAPASDTDVVSDTPTRRA